MSKTTAPLLSFGASGQIAKSMVMSSWRGVPYARRYVIPANPRTAAQTKTRDLFRVMNQFYALAPAPVLASFNAYATGRAFLPRNHFVGQNVKIFSPMMDPDSMDGLMVSPGARGGIPARSITAIDNAGTIEVSFAMPEAPNGWTLTNAHALAFIDQAPTELFDQEILSGSDNATSPQVDLVTETAGDYVVCAFLEWLKPNGDAAYSRSLSDTVTVAA